MFVILLRQRRRCLVPVERFYMKQSGQEVNQPITGYD
jgi:putative SOS response-associated peptidase YedK